MSTLHINTILDMFSLHNYIAHANRLNMNSGMRDMLIGLYGNLLDFAKDTSNPNVYGTLSEIIKQYNTVAIIAPFDDSIINLQKQLDEKDIKIAELQAQLSNKDNTIEILNAEIQTLYQRY
jgi:peptidoglycan hydrolase CwlO-like protein